MASTDTFPLTLPYGVDVSVIPGTLAVAGESSKRFERRKRADQRLFRITYQLNTDEWEQLRDFYNRFRGQNQYFVFNYPTWLNNAGTFVARKFPVEWLAPPAVLYVTNELYDVEVSLIEAVDRALETADYPVFTAPHPIVTFEEDHPDAGAVVGTWTSAANGLASAGNEKTNPNTNTTDKFRYVYAGYAFRLKGVKGPARGIYEVLLDAASLGNVDLYATTNNLQVLFTKTDVKLGLHTVELKATNTKNAASSGNTIAADAVEFIP